MDHDQNDLHSGASGGDKGSTRVSGLPVEGWMRSALENASEIVKVVDPDGTLRYANSAFRRALGYDPEEAIGRMNVLDYVHPDDLPHVLGETEKALSKVGVATNEAQYRFMHADGSWRWMEAAGTYLLDDPHVRGVVINARDVTERKEAEEQLRFQAQFLGAVGEAVVAIDADGRVVYWNRVAEETYGWSVEEALGRPIREMVVPEDLLDRAEEIMVRGGSTWTGEFVVRRRDGTLSPVEATNTPVFGENGILAGVTSVFKDVTERKQSEEALRRSEAELFCVLESITDGFFALDREWRFAYVNPQAEVLLDRAREDLVGERIWEDSTFYPEYQRAVSEGRTVTFEGYYPPLEKWYGVRAYPSQSGLSVYFQDITEHKKAEEALRESEERYRTVVEEQAELVCRYLPDLTVTFANEAYCRYFGVEPEDVMGESFIGRVAPEDRPYYGQLLTRLNRDHPRRTVEHRVLTPDGGVRWQQWTDVAIVDDNGRVVEYQSVGRDVTERRALEERLEHQAFHDPLTGLPNRRLFVDRLGQALRRTRRRRGRRVAVLFMDLDNFKGFNDSLGHEAGDLLLVVVAERLKRCLRPEDTLARFGGDEFVVLVEDVEDPGEAVRVAGRIIEGFGSPFWLEGRELYARGSIGIALGEDRTKSPEDLLRHADTAMYRAKESGAGYSVFDLAMYERALGRLELENGLRRAVEREEFVVHYQPIVRLGDGEVWGVEALVRWEHPERGLLEPDEFVPVAEERGLVVPMGERVLREACRRAKRWQEDYPHVPPLVMSVNLSARQLGRRDLAEAVEGAIRETGLEASCLSLDVTETVYVKALEGNTGTLARLRAMGVGISIDDFGVGYSSLANLKRLPADAIKIDKSFVKGLGEDAEGTAIVRTVVELAHIFGMEVVAEGVETEEQATLLREMGCDLGQGYHFSKPLPPEEVPELLARMSPG